MTAKMLASTGLGEAIGGFLGLATTISAMLVLVHRASPHRWLQVLIFMAGLIVSVVAMIVCAVLGNGAARLWYSRKSAPQPGTEKQDISQ